MSVILCFGSSVECQTTGKNDNEIPLCMIIPNTIKIVSVSAGSRHSLLLTSNGIIYSYGWGVLGQLGLGDNQSALTPTRVAGLVNIRSVSAGGMHSGCVDSENRCYTWGSNAYGQLGILDPPGAGKAVSTPRLVYKHAPEHAEQEPLLVESISCGGMHTGAVDLLGQLWCWGRADNGQIGFTTRRLLRPHPTILDSTSVSIPYQVSEVSGRCRRVSCGAFHTLFVNYEGEVYSMGKDSFGILGTSLDVNNCLKNGSDTPMQITKLSDYKIKDVDCSGWHNVFLTEDGKAFTCGKGEYGRLGVGSEQNHTEPVPCQFFHERLVPSKVAAVSAGGSHTMLLTEDDTIYCCGRTDNGRCGIIYQDTDRVKKFVNISLRDHLCSTVVVGSHDQNHTPMDTPEQTLRKGSSAANLTSTVQVRSRLYYEKDITKYKVTSFSAGGSHSLVLLSRGDSAFDLIPVDQMPEFLLPGVKSSTRGHGSPKRVVKSPSKPLSQGESSAYSPGADSESALSAYESMHPPGSYNISVPPPAPSWDK